MGLAMDTIKKVNGEVFSIQTRISEIEREQHQRQLKSVGGLTNLAQLTLDSLNTKNIEQIRAAYSEKDLVKLTFSNNYLDPEEKGKILFAHPF